MNKPVFTKKEWEKIESFAFSDTAPDPKFSESYKKKRAALIASAERKRQRLKISAAMTAVIAAALLIPAAAVAADRIYRSYLEKAAEYEVELHAAETNESLGEIPVMSLDIGYVPEGMTYNEDGPFAGKYREAADPYSEKGITPQFIKINDPESFRPSVSFSVAQESFTAAGGGEAYIIERDKGYDQLWVFFPDTPYAALLYINGFENNEIRKIADGLSLTPSDTETAEIWHQPEIHSKTNYANYDNAELPGLNLCSVGDTFGTEDTQLTVDSLRVQDNFEGIDTDCIGLPADYSSYLDENGKITGERILIRRGDGINTLDSEISRESVTRMVIVMELTGKNKSDHEINLLINPKMFLIEGNKSVSPSEPAEDDCYYEYTIADDLDSDDLQFSYYADSGKRDKNSVYLPAGESTRIRLAFVADADKLDGLYFDMGSPDGARSSDDPVIKLYHDLS